MFRAFGHRPTQVPIKSWNIVKDDFVQVTEGRYKNSRGKVMKVLRRNNHIVVSGVNMVSILFSVLTLLLQKYKTVEDEEYQQRKKIIQKEFPIHVSNVALIDPQLDLPTKIKYGYLEDGTKVRLSKKSGAIIPKPDRSHLTYINRTKKKEDGLLDTKSDLVLLKTYKGEDFMRVKAEFEEFIRMKEEKESLLVF
jgi:large subunit ribosomal protein L24